MTFTGGEAALIAFVAAGIGAAAALIWRPPSSPAYLKAKAELEEERRQRQERDRQLAEIAAELAEEPVGTARSRTMKRVARTRQRGPDGRFLPWS